MFFLRDPAQEQQATHESSSMGSALGLIRGRLEKVDERNARAARAAIDALAQAAYGWAVPARRASVLGATAGRVPAEVVTDGTANAGDGGDGGGGADQACFLLYLHGGGFVVGSPSTHRDFVRQLCREVRKASGCRGRNRSLEALVPDYRKAPEHPFPAALDDCCAAYRLLLRRAGGDASRVVLAGDSAGGNLCLSLLLRCSSSRGEMPLPACCLLVSPWLDLTDAKWSLADAGMGSAAPLSSVPEAAAAARDVLPVTFLRVARNAYLGGGREGGQRPAVAADPLVSPLLAEARQLAALPPIQVHAAASELLSDQSRKLGEKSPGNVEVVLWSGPHLPHIFPVFFRAIPAGRAALVRGAQFIDACLPQEPISGPTAA